MENELNNYMSLFIFLMFTILLYIFFFELVAYLARGWFISDKRLKWVEDHIEDYIFDDFLFYAFFAKSGVTMVNHPRINKCYSTLFSAWSIDGYGRIPRWSKYSRMLDRIAKQNLPVKEIPKKLF